MLLCSGRSFAGCFNNVFILSPEIALSGRGKSIEDSLVFGLQCFFFFAAFCDSHEASEHFKEYCC